MSAKTENVVTGKGFHKPQMLDVRNATKRWRSEEMEKTNCSFVLAGIVKNFLPLRNEERLKRVRSIKRKLAHT